MNSDMTAINTTQSRRDCTLLTVGFSLRIAATHDYAKSRRDDTLLTALAYRINDELH